MRRLFSTKHAPISLFTLLACLAAQSAGAAIVSGTVTDAAGKPVADARVDHTGKKVVAPSILSGTPGETRTDADGRFRFEIDVPFVVVRKPGYESQRLRVTSDAQVSVTLQPIKAESRCKLSPAPEVKTREANDEDYTATWFYIETKDGPKGILSGSGLMYSWGAPEDKQVWTSVEYSEAMAQNGVIDAWGHTADGKYWRLRAVFGAAAHYYNVDRETAGQLDCVMDRVSVEPPVQVKLK